MERPNNIVPCGIVFSRTKYTENPLIVCEAESLCDKCSYIKQLETKIKEKDEKIYNLNEWLLSIKDAVSEFIKLVNK